MAAIPTYKKLALLVAGLGEGLGLGESTGLGEGFGLGDGLGLGDGVGTEGGGLPVDPLQEINSPQNKHSATRSDPKDLRLGNFIQCMTATHFCN